MNKHIPGGGSQLFSEQVAQNFRAISAESVERYEEQINSLNTLRAIVVDANNDLFRRFGHIGYEFVRNWLERQVSEEKERLQASKRVCEWGVIMVDHAQDIDEGKFYHLTWWFTANPSKQYERLIPLRMAEHFGGVEEALRVDIKEESADLSFIYPKTLVDRDGKPYGEKGESHDISN